MTYSSYVRLQSIVTPRFFADLDDVISLLSSICGDPRPRSFVLFGLMSRLFLQHHAATFWRSSVSRSAAKVASHTGNERYNSESST